MAENHLPIKLKRVSWHVVDENDDTIFEGFPGEESNLDEMINRWHLHPVLVEALKGAEKLKELYHRRKLGGTSTVDFIEIEKEIYKHESAIHSALAQVRGK